MCYISLHSESARLISFSNRYWCTFQEFKTFFFMDSKRYLNGCLLTIKSEPFSLGNKPYEVTFSKSKTLVC